MRIDSHQHFWKFDPVRDSWIDENMSALRRDFLPEDLEPLLRENKVAGCVAVQADQSENETFFLTDLAVKHDFIKGVVGWVDLSAGNVEERLEYFSTFKSIKGFRHIVQAEPAPDFILRTDFCRGISKLKKFDFSYDILILPRHLPYMSEFISQFPDQRFVIDHLAKPNIRKGEVKEWEKHLRKAAAFENLHCKLSGMATEADLHHWKSEDFKPYINVVIEAFGIDRVMFGSDWPVCLTAATYQQSCLILEHNTMHLSDAEKEKLWGLNAAKFYKLEL